MLRKVWNKITYPFPKFNDTAVEVWEWMNNFIPHSMMDVITYPYWDCLVLRALRYCYQWTLHQVGTPLPITHLGLKKLPLFWRRHFKFIFLCESRYILNILQKCVPGVSINKMPTLIWINSWSPADILHCLSREPNCKDFGSRHGYWFYACWTPSIACWLFIHSYIVHMSGLV